MTFESDDIVDSGATKNTAAEVETEQTEWQPKQQTEGEQPTELSDEEKAKQEAEQEGEKQKKSRATKRVQDALTRATIAEQKLAEYEAKANQPAQASEGPAIEDFEDYSEFKKAERKWLMDEAKREFREEMLAEKQQQTQIEKQAEFEAVITTVAETYPDFDSVVQAGLQRDLPMPLTLDEVASEFGYSPETQVKLLYEIGKNEALHETLSGSSKLKAARILSEIVDSWETKPAPKVSKAPPPIKPVQANAPAARSPEKMSDDEWYRAETQLRKGK